MKNIVFDLGRVLIDWNADKALHKRFPDQTHHSLIKQSIFEHEDWLAMDKGTLTEEAAIANFHARTGFAPQELALLMHDVRESLTPLEDSWTLLHELHQQGYPLYCLSNMPASAFAHLKARYDRWHVFKGIVISGEVGMMKPHLEIFEHLLQTYRLVPEHTVFIDDLATNISGAQRVGMHGIQFTDVDACRSSLKLLEILVD